MGTKSQIGNGIKLSFEPSPGDGFVDIAEITDLKLPDETQESVKVYRSDNATATVEKIAGWRENADAEVTLTYAHAQRTLLEAAKGLTTNWKVTFPKQVDQTVAGDSETWSGFLSELGRETPLKDSMTCKCKIAVSGAITYAAGS